MPKKGKKSKRQFNGLWNRPSLDINGTLHIYPSDKVDGEYTAFKTIFVRKDGMRLTGTFKGRLVTDDGDIARGFVTMGKKKDDDADFESMQSLLKPIIKKEAQKKASDDDDDDNAPRGKKVAKLDKGTIKDGIKALKSLADSFSKLAK